MLASPTALKDYLFTDSEAEYQVGHYVPPDISLFVSAINAISGSSEYQLEHNVPVDISRRELSAPAGKSYVHCSHRTQGG
jgi:hypothetical protein